MTAESTAEPLLTISKNRLASIAFHAVGIQTEGGDTPYTGPANAGGSSGISIGVMQHDFGQSKTLTLTYAQAIVNWNNENNTTLSVTPETIAAALSAPPTSGLLTNQIRGAIASFGGSGQGSEWIFRNFDQGHINTAVLAAQQAFATPYGQAVLLEGTHVEEFAAFAMKIRNQYGPGIEGGNGAIKSPGFGALMDYLKNGTVKLLDSQHPGQTTTVVASHPDEFNRQDLLSFARAYTDTRSKLNEAVYKGPVAALDSGVLYGAILDSDSPLSDVLMRVEKKGNFSPTLVTTDPDVALARAMFGADTGRMSKAVAAINDATTLDPVGVSVTLGQYPGTLWVDPLSGRIALSYKNSSSGFVVGANGYAKFSASTVVKDDNVRTLQIGEGDATVSFEKIATPLANSPLSRETAAPPIGHWEERTVYTDLGIPFNTQMVWVAGPAAPTATPPAIPPVSTAPPTNHATTGMIYLSRDGASATLPDGQVINAGPGGRLDLDADGNLSATRPVTGYSPDESVYSVTLYSKSGQTVASTQMQVVTDPAHPGDPSYNTIIIQGQVRDITQLQTDGSTTVVRTVFQTGFGWIEQGTGEIVQSMAEWAQERLGRMPAPPSGDGDGGGGDGSDGGDGGDRGETRLLNFIDDPDDAGGVNRSVEMMVNGKVINLTQHAGAATLSNGMQDNDFENTGLIVGGRSNALVNAALQDANINAHDILLGRGTGELIQLATVIDPTDADGFKAAEGASTQPGKETAWYATAEAQEFGRTLTDVQSLLAALKGGSPLPVAVAVFNMAATATHSAELGTIGGSLSAAASLKGFRDSLARGDELSALASGSVFVKTALQGVQGVLGAQISNQYGSVLAARAAIDEGDQLAQEMMGQFDGMGAVIDGIGKGLPYLNLINAISKGDEVGMLTAGLAILAQIPEYAALGPVGWVIAGIQIFISLLDDDSPDIRGSAQWVQSGDGKNAYAQLVSQGSDGGGAPVMSAMTNLLAGLQAVVHGEFPQSDMGLIAARLPWLTFAGYAGGGGEFTLHWKDSHSGETYARRFSADGDFIGVGVPGTGAFSNQRTELSPQDIGLTEVANSPDFFKNMGQQFVDIASGKLQGDSAVVQAWESQTALAQANRGSALAGLNTEQRARAQGMWLGPENPGNATLGNTAQSVRPIVLDLDGNGISVTTQAQGGSVNFDQLRGMTISKPGVNLKNAASFGSRWV